MDAGFSRWEQVYPCATHEEAIATAERLFADASEQSVHIEQLVISERVTGDPGGGFVLFVKYRGVKPGGEGRHGQ